MTADGARIWVADQNNMRVQYFDRAPDLSYRYAGLWDGAGTAWDGELGAIYGVALDPWGFVYLTQTSTRQIWRLDPDGTNPQLIASQGAAAAAVHTLAVDGRGRVFVGEWCLRLDRPAGSPALPPLPLLPPEPTPDRTAPTISAVTSSGDTSAAIVAVRIIASDDTGVTQMRLSDERGEWGIWQPYRSDLDVTLSPGIGAKLITAQVRDRVERESESMSVRVVRLPIQDLADPTVTVRAPERIAAGPVSLGIAAEDDIAVTHLRIAGEDGSFGDWQPWGSGMRTLIWSPPTATGTFTISIQVRDAARRVSGTVTVRVAVGATSAPVAPVVPVVPVARVVPVVPVVIGGGPMAAPDPAAVDRVAPRISSVRVPRTACRRSIIVRLVASDDRALAQVRIANESGIWSGWRTYRGALRHNLSRGLGPKHVSLQVADAAGNVSGVIARRLAVVRCL